MTTTFYDHWRDVPESAWRWPNFSPAEIACRGTGKLLVNDPALDKLQALRDRLGKPLIVRSAYRSPEHNRAVGGATRSKHMDGAAFDIAMSNHDPVAFEAAARAVGFLGFGFYPRSGFMHVDLGPARHGASGSRSARLPSPRKRRPRAKCWPRAARMKGGGAAGVATLVPQVSRSRTDVLAETQTAILPLVPYLDTCAGCSSPWRWSALPSPSTPGSTTGSGGSGDRRTSAPSPAAHGAQGAALRWRCPHHCSVPAVESAAPASASGGSLERLETRREANEIQTPDAGGRGSPSPWSRCFG